MPAEPDDPGFAIPRGALHWTSRDTPERASLARASAELRTVPGEPLDTARTKPAERRRKWKAALAASCLLHMAAAAFLLAGNHEAVMIAGSEQAGVMLLGNAPEDQVAAGETAHLPDTTQVTLVTMLEPKPVQTVAAAAVPVANAVAPAETEVVEAAPAEAVEAAPETVAPITEQAIAEPVAEAPPPTAADPAPEILTARTLQPVEDETAVPEHAEQVAEQPDTPTPAVPSEAAPVESVEAEKTPSPTTPSETAPVETAERVVAEAEKPKPVEKKTVAKAEREKPRKEPVREAKPARKAEKTPAKAATEKPKAGSGGSGVADTRRGVAQGEAAGTTANASRGGAASSAGNAAVSNYPGKVAARLRRAVRSISSLARMRARSDVQVAFVVDAGGGVGGIRVIRSSGSPELDQAALAVVRRAAPFPPIPPQAGRSSWAFTLPLGIAR